MITIKDLADLKSRGQKWAMLTSYEMMTAEIFDEAGIEVILVGDSAADCSCAGDGHVGRISSLECRYN